MKKVVGYITSSHNNANFVPHSVQNQIIKSFIESKGFTYLLSWTEFKDLAPSIYLSLIEEKFYDGICFYSLNQIDESPELFLQTFTSKKIEWLAFAQEKIIVTTDKEWKLFYQLLQLRILISNNTPTSRNLWDNYNIL